MRGGRLVPSEAGGGVGLDSIDCREVYERVLIAGGLTRRAPRSLSGREVVIVREV